MPLRKKLLIIPPVLLGLALLTFAARNRAAPTKKPPTEASRTLRVIQTARTALVPRVIAYGTSKPGRVWRVVPEVSGRITRLDDRVRPGGIIPAGVEILHIDSATYLLTVSRLKAEIAQTRAELSQLAGVERNLKASGAIEESNLELAKKEVERTQGLLAKGSATARQVDQAQQALLIRRQTVQGISNELRLLPSQRAGLAASLQVKGANLAQAELDLAKTVIRTPFACRVNEVQLEVVQYVKAGETLFEASSIDLAEVGTQLTLEQARWLMDHPRSKIAVEHITAGLIQKLFGGTAEVRVRSGKLTFRWPARLVRVRERVDQETRTVSFVVAVDKPYQRAAAGGPSPPLLAGMYCEVELKGRPRPDRILIPRVALHADHVYVIDAERRLRKRAVEVGARQDDFLVVKTGLEPGESVVVSDPTPAVEAGLTEPVRDEALEQRIKAAASGE